MPIQVVNPRQARDFAKATGRLAKADRPGALVARRRQLQAMVIAEENRRRGGILPG